MRIDLRRVPARDMARDDSLLYSESAGRFIVTVRPDDKAVFEEIMKDNVIGQIGTVVAGTEFTIIGLRGDIVLRADIFELKEAWQKTLRF
jgi:phosphoribosylformylglycinamidine synthase